MEARVDVVVVAWTTYASDGATLYANASTDGGVSWRGAVPLREGTPKSGSLVGSIDIGITGSGTMVVAYDWRPREQRWNVYSHVSRDRGRSWSRSAQLSSGWGRSVRLATAAGSSARSGSGIAAIWKEGPPPRISKAAYSHDGG
jgi:hypothetical protein